MSILTHLEVGLEFNDSAAVMDRDYWGDPVVAATRVQWRADLGQRGVVVSVTAFADSHKNRSWFDPRFFVAPGLNSEPPPEWVPPAPDWFWAAVEAMGADR